MLDCQSKPQVTGVLQAAVQLGIKRLNIVGDSKLVVQQACAFVTVSPLPAAVHRHDDTPAAVRAQNAQLSYPWSLQVEGAWQCGAVNLQPLHALAQSLMRSFDFVSARHVLRLLFLSTCQDSCGEANLHR